MIPLIDISHHQGTIDWDIIAASGVPGVIIRAGNGVTPDPLCARNMAEAARVGLKRAAYWFANPKATATGAEQGQSLALAHLKYGCELPPMWDVESYTNEPGTFPQLSGAAAARWQADMAQTLNTSCGRVSFGYTGASFWNSRIAPGKFDIAFGRVTPEWQADLAFLHSHDFILARYPGQRRSLTGQITDLLPRGVPPSGWEAVAMGLGPSKEPPPLTGRPQGWDGWQWSAGGNAQGRIYGCESLDLDLSIIHADVWSRWTRVSSGQEDDVAYIVSNAEAQDGTEGPGVSAGPALANKYRVQEDGTFKPQSSADIKALGLTNSFALGVPMYNAEMAGKYWTAPQPAPIDVHALAAEIVAQLPPVVFPAYHPG